MALITKLFSCKRRLKSLANSWDTDYDRYSVGADLGSKPFDTDSFPEIIFLKKLMLKKVNTRQKKHEKLPSMQTA